MPIREYTAKNKSESCDYCREGFEKIEGINTPALKKCPKCGAPIKRIISAPRIGRSESGLDDRAKEGGFHKYKKLSQGEYEKQY
jgi:putative FmdB family regulatory protein